MAERRRAGRVEAATRRELRGFGPEAARSVLAELALTMARAIDAQADRVLEGTPAQLSALAKAQQELRVTLGQLREVSSGNGDDDREDGFSVPDWDDGAAVRDAAQP